MSDSNLEANYLKALKIARREGDYSREAHALILAGAQQEHGPSQYALATWYLAGYGKVKRNIKEAVRLLKASANSGVADAWFDLAVCYEEGEGVRRSKAHAFRCYVLAAVLGDKKAVFEAGRLLHHFELELSAVQHKMSDDLLKVAERFGTFEPNKEQ